MEDPMISRLIQMGETYPQIRAIILTSSRARPGADCDLFSDYDPILYTTDQAFFLDNDSWYESLGPVLAVFRDSFSDREEPRYMRMIFYEDGTKIDFTIATTRELERESASMVLPEYLDVGYSVLLDKDGRTSSLAPPTHRAHIPSIPTEAFFAERMNNFWTDSMYVAKYLWREDLMAVKFMLEGDLIQNDIRQLLEWGIEIERGWNWKPGHYGRGIRNALASEVYAELAALYAGGDFEELWESFFRTTAMFRKTARKVAESLGYIYPEDLDRKVSAYHHAVRKLYPKATSRDELAMVLKESYDSQCNAVRKDAHL